MWLTWLLRLQYSPLLRDYKNWPKVNHKKFKGVKRTKFLRNQRIVIKVLLGIRFKDIADEENISVSAISRLMSRALAGYEDDDQPLTKALIPGQKINNGKRKKSLSKHKCSGARGSFTKILEENIEMTERLKNKVKAFVRRDPNAENMTPKSFHKAFLAELEDLNWPDDQYPFDQSNKALESCRRYFHKLVNKYRMPKKKKQRSINQTQIIDLLPFQKIQLDSQLTDIKVNIAIDDNGVIKTLKLSRLSLFMMKDVASDCILSYFLCYTKEPNQDDLLNLFSFLNEKWEPMELKTPGLEYQLGACLPSALDEEFQFRSIGIVGLDNAKCHRAKSIKDYVLITLGATLNYGLPANPKSRQLIEYAFKLLNEIIHRFPSTTGSHVLDPLKETKSNTKKVPTFSLRTLEEVISVVVSAENTRPRERLGGLSPLDYLKYQNERHPLRINYAMREDNIGPFVSQDTRKICWYKSDNRAPEISFNGLRYVGEGLNESELENQKITIRFDRRDLRVVEAFKEDGTSLGALMAPLSWQSHPFSLRTKKRISKYTRKENLKLKDPLRNMFDIHMRDKHLPSEALEIVRLAKEFNSSINTFDHLKTDDEINDFNNNSNHEVDLTQTGKSHNPFEWNRGLFKGEKR